MSDAQLSSLAAQAEQIPRAGADSSELGFPRRQDEAKLDLSYSSELALIGGDSTTTSKNSVMQTLVQSVAHLALQDSDSLMVELYESTASQSSQVESSSAEGPSLGQSSDNTKKKMQFNA